MVWVQPPNSRFNSRNQYTASVSSSKLPGIPEINSNLHWNLRFSLVFRSLFFRFDFFLKFKRVPSFPDMCRCIWMGVGEGEKWEWRRQRRIRDDSQLFYGERFVSCCWFFRFSALSCAAAAFLERWECDLCFQWRNEEEEDRNWEPWGCVVLVSVSDRKSVV